MLYKIIHFFKFHRSATNQHGVHSPFVYQYITQGLYTKNSLKLAKPLKVLVLSISYFKAQHVFFKTKLQQQEITKHLTGLVINKPPYDIIYWDDIALENLLELLNDSQKTHNDTIILLPNIHKNPQCNAQWKALVELSKVTVSIDFFSLGFLSCRSEQQKEHFKIRI